MAATLCNLCGEPCGDPCRSCEHAHTDTSGDGLINAAVYGGYNSTPGNGCGALDDMTRYQFSLCEFCLDWLFCQFKTPPLVHDIIGDNALDEAKEFRPAAVRVRDDEWRRTKDRFYDEVDRRAVLRKVAGDGR